MAMPARLAVQSVRQMSGHAIDVAAVEAGKKRWIAITMFIGLPFTGIALGNVIYEDFIKGHDHPRPEFKQYEHLRIRSRPYPWRDGVKSIFHNPKTNALPEGYEE